MLTLIMKDVELTFTRELEPGFFFYQTRHPFLYNSEGELFLITVVCVLDRW